MRLYQIILAAGITATSLLGCNEQTTARTQNNEYKCVRRPSGEIIALKGDLRIRYYERKGIEWVLHASEEVNKYEALKAIDACKKQFDDQSLEESTK